MEPGDIVRLKRFTTVRRNPTVVSEATYRAPKGKDFVVLVIGACAPDEDEKALTQTILNGMGWDLQALGEASR